MPGRVFPLVSPRCGLYNKRGGNASPARQAGKEAEGLVSDIHFWIDVLFYAYLAIAALYLLLDNREPATTMAWLLLFILLPIVGFVIYFFLGRNWRKHPKNKQLDQEFGEKALQKYLPVLLREQRQHLLRHRKFWEQPKYKLELVKLLLRNSKAVLTVSNRVQLFHDGREKFAALLRDLAAAEAYIFMEYFIWRNDALTRRIQELLIAKARRGVRVLILIDSFGSLGLGGRYIRELRRAGVRVYKYYNFLSPLKLHTLNYRNHRKIVIIDGRIAYTGGMNMGQEYADGGRRFAFWRDAHLRLEGPVLPILQAVFAVDWYNTTHEDLFGQNYFRAIDRRPARGGRVPLQIITSGPDSHWDSIKQLYFGLITSAVRSVHIQSPYFIPDPSIQMALKTAGLRGLDVRLMITGNPDRWLPFWSATTYFGELLEAGVRVFQYRRGFLHSKTLSVDGEICSVGTANMDLRSFSLNYELNTLIYDATLAQEVKRQFLRDQVGAREITLDSYRRLQPLTRLGHSLARLLAPLL